MRQCAPNERRDNLEKLFTPHTALTPAHCGTGIKEDVEISVMM